MSYFDTPATGNNADLARHIEKLAELDRYIEQSAPGSTEWHTYTHLRRVLLDSYVDTAAKIGKKP